MPAPTPPSQTPAPDPALQVTAGGQAEDTPTERVRRLARGEDGSPVDTGLILTGDVRRFYGEVVTNTYLFPFSAKTAKGEVKLTVRLVDAATGAVLVEQAVDQESRVGGGDDRVNGELNTAFSKAVHGCWSAPVLEALAKRAQEAIAARRSEDLARQKDLQETALMTVDRLLPAPDYAAIPLASLKAARPDSEWTAQIEAEVRSWFGSGMAVDEECLRLARSCNFSRQASKVAGTRTLLVTIVPPHTSLDALKGTLHERALPWLALQSPQAARCGVWISTLDGGNRLMALVVNSAPRP